MVSGESSSAKQNMVKVKNLVFVHGKQTIRRGRDSRRQQEVLSPIDRPMLSADICQEKVRYIY